MPTRRLRVEIEPEVDGRFLAAVVDLPGAMAYGVTADEAQSRALALALRVLAEQVEAGEPATFGLTCRPEPA